MAAPHVAGVAARYLQSNPGATPAAVRNELVAQATAGLLTGVPSGTSNRLLFWSSYAMTFRRAGGRGLMVWAVLCVLVSSGGHGSQAVPLKFATVQRGDLSGIEERREAVIRTAAEWASLWKQHQPDQKPPAIDFTRSMVAGVFLGSRPTGGYALEVTAVERDGADLVVIYREGKPDPKMMVTQMITSPFHLVRIDRHAGPVRFRAADTAANK